MINRFELFEAALDYVSLHGLESSRKMAIYFPEGKAEDVKTVLLFSEGNLSTSVVDDVWSIIKQQFILIKNLSMK
jgi:hypothetical protein